MVAESMPGSILPKGLGPHGDQHSTALGQAPPHSQFLIEEGSFSTSLWRTLSKRAGSPPMVSEKRPAVFNHSSDDDRRLNRTGHAVLG